MIPQWDHEFDVFSGGYDEYFGGMTTHDIGNGGVAISGTYKSSANEYDAFILLIDESGSRIE